MNGKIALWLLVISLTLLLVFNSFTISALPSPKPLYPKDKSKIRLMVPSDTGRGRGKGSKGRLPSPDLSKPNKWAVIIGIADYEGKANDLWHPDEDAKEMYYVLINFYGFARDHIILLTNKKATAEAILNAIDWLITWENSTSIVVFFYSGHGYNASEDVTSQYEYPIDETDGIDECIVSYDLYAIPDDLLKEKLSQIESNNVFLWFGSCFSGGMNDIFHTLATLSRTIVLTSACQETQLTYDVLQLGNTLFGYYYVDEGIIDGKADGYGPNGVLDEIITVEEAFYYADEHVNAFVQLYNLEPSDPEIFDSVPDVDFYLG